MPSSIFLVLALVVGFAGVTHGQQVISKHPRPFLCTPPNCNYPPPTVSISPGTETVTNASVAVTITMCDTVTLANDTVYLNGGNITSQFTSTSGGSAGCNVKKTLTGNVSLNLGANTLRAVVSGTATNGSGLQQASASVTYTYTPPVYGATVTVSPQLLDTARAGQQYTTTFTVKNTGNVTDSLTWTAACTGPAIQTCGSESSTGKTLAAGTSTNVTLNWTAAGLPSAVGTISLTANDRGTGSGVATETVGEYAAGLDVVDANPGPSFNRSNCLTVAVAPHAAWECGDLRITHALPSVRTYNKVRTPTLVYNWRFATPEVNLGAYLTIAASSANLDSVHATLCVVAVLNPGSPSCQLSGTWSGLNWNNGTTQTTRRIQLGWAGYTMQSGAYNYYFKTIRYYDSSGTHRTAQDSAGNWFIFNNWYDSQYGAGWSLAGLEALQPLSDRIVWFGGDGSTQVYYATNYNVWSPGTYVSGRDSIKLDSSNTYFTRYLPHGARVVYNRQGTQLMTIGRIGDTTRFEYDPVSSGISKIIIPTPNHDTTSMVYLFSYDAGQTITQVSAPGPNGTRRIVHFNTSWSVNGAHALIMGIQDPDTLTTTFTYDTTSGGQTRILSRTDKRRTQATFGFGYGIQTLGQAQIHMQGTGSDIIHTFFMPQGFGQNVPSSASPDSIAVKITGPRWNAYLAGAPKDSADTTWIWIDRWWQPTRIVDAKGATTSIVRLNSTYPTLITRLVDPLGREQTAVYDKRGNDSVLTDFGTYVGGQYATTKYLADSLWDFDTLTTLPVGEQLHDSLDASGNRLWEQLGPSNIHRTSFGYGGPCSNIVSSITLPGTAKDSLIYDGARCDLAGEMSPRGYWTTYTTDTVGRVVTAMSPIDSADHTLTLGSYARATVQHIYDVMDRDSITTTSGPAVPSLPGSVPQTLTVTRSFDPEGNVLWTERKANPDSTSIGVLHTGTVYDRANRATFDTAVNKAVTTRTYDAASNVTAVVTRRGYPITNVYDALNRLVSKIVPSFTADTIFTGIPTDTLNGGGFGRPAQHDTSSGTNGYTPYIGLPYGRQLVHGDTVTLSYDSAGRLIEADNVNARISRQYYLNGLLRSETQRVRTLPDGGASGDFTKHVYVIGYHYDRDGRRDSLYYPARFVAASATGTVGYAQAYTYDTATGWLSGTTDVAGGQFAFAYSGRGDLIATTYPSPFNGADSLSWDGDGNVSRDKVEGSGIVARLMGFTYDARDKLLRAGNQASLLDTVWAVYTGLGYAARDSSVDSTGTKNSTIERFRYDAFGNRMTDTTSSGIVEQRGNTNGKTLKTWSYQQPNTGWLTYVQDFANNYSETYQYDASGNTHFEYVSFYNLVPSLPEVHDRASFYNAEDRLVEADYRIVYGPDNSVLQFMRADEVSRYDALGRRVLVHASRTCGPYQGSQTFKPDDCRRSFVRRTVYDGQQALAEIQQPDSSLAPAIAEADSGVTPLQYDQNVQESPVDNNPFFGQVLYTHALGIDQPVSVIRLNYANVMDTLGNQLPYNLYPPLVVVPVWNFHGHEDVNFVGQVLNGSVSAFPGCTARCPIWPTDIGLAAYNSVPRFASRSWFGTLLEDQYDQTFTQYRRARAYDPVTGRFTQPDPIGLAGGINDFGFANGDPVNYSDPFGLRPCPPDNDCDIGASEALSALTGAGRLLQPAQGPLEVGGMLAVAPLGGGIGATEEISGEVLALGATLRSGAGSGILTAAGVAGRVAEATGGVASAMKNGAKVTVSAARDIVARIKATGEVRVSIDGIGSLTKQGVVSADRALTHLRNLSSDEITGLVNKAREFLTTPR